MKNKIFLLLMAFSLFGCGSLAQKPKGDLIYCSYSRNGAAGLGKDYCELIADVDSVPKVVVVLNEENRFDDPVIKRTYPVDKSVVDSLYQILAGQKVYQLNGYRVEEPICGGYSYRIYMEYSSGEKINAFWYGNKIKDKAIRAYNTIEHFFTPWRNKAKEDEKALKDEPVDEEQ